MPSTYRPYMSSSCPSWSDIPDLSRTSDSGRIVSWHIWKCPVEGEKWRVVWPPEEGLAGLAGVGPVVAVPPSLGPAHLAGRPWRSCGGAPVTQLPSSLGWQYLTGTGVRRVEIVDSWQYKPLSLPLCLLIFDCSRGFFMGRVCTQRIFQICSWN